MKQSRYYPSQQELHTPDKLERVLRDAYDRLYSLTDKTASTQTKLEVQQTDYTTRLNTLSTTVDRVSRKTSPTYTEGTRALMQTTSSSFDLSVYRQTEPLVGIDLYYTAYNGAWHFTHGTWTASFASRPTPDDTGHLTDAAYAHAADDGVIFLDTTYGITWKYVRASMAWVYQSGTYANTLAGIPTLTAAEAGFRFWATDYQHTWVWSGSAWAWDLQDEGSGYIEVRSQAPRVGLWQVCDGSTIPVSTTGGGTSSVTIPDLSTAAYLKIGASADLTPHAPSGGLVNTGTPSATATVQSGSGVTVAHGTHTHAVDESAMELRRIQLIAYYRR